MGSPARKPSARKRPHIVARRPVDEGVVEQAFQESRALRIVAVLAVALLASYIFLALFEPDLKYQLSDTPAGLESAEFQKSIEALADARLSRDNRIEVLANGEHFYAAELDAIRHAQRSIDLEAYIWYEGDLTKMVLEALTERARAGVKVRVVLDGAGSAKTPRRSFKPLLEAGGRVEFYHPMSWKTFWRYNNRTHRELLVIDGKIGFVGGAGFGDHWILTSKGNPRWRDNMFRVTGDAVSSLQGTFVENWLEASGEVVSGAQYFQADGAQGHATAMVVNSSPTQGRSTRARILMGTLIGGAKKSIYITTPYFLPDRGAMRELLQAKRRGVDVKILVPNQHNDHALTRASSRGYYGELLKAGAQVFEYQPSMLHAKVLVVDGEWSVVGSTNFDSRSFNLNDEVNLVAFDPELAGKLTELFYDDLNHSREITYDGWRKRPLWERALGSVGWLVSRQQ